MDGSRTAWELSVSPTCPRNGPASTRCLDSLCCSLSIQTERVADAMGLQHQLDQALARPGAMTLRFRDAFCGHFLHSHQWQLLQPSTVVLRDGARHQPGSVRGRLAVATTPSGWRPRRCATRTRPSATPQRSVPHCMGRGARPHPRVQWARNPTVRAGSNPPGPTTHSFKPRRQRRRFITVWLEVQSFGPEDFPETTSQRPVIGGLP
jgi:hypothetical protein